MNEKKSGVPQGIVEFIITKGNSLLMIMGVNEIFTPAHPVRLQLIKLVTGVIYFVLRFKYKLHFYL